MYFIFTKNSIPQFMLQYVMVDSYCRKNSSIQKQRSNKELVTFTVSKMANAIHVV